MTMLKVLPWSVRAAPLVLVLSLAIQPPALGAQAPGPTIMGQYPSCLVPISRSMEVPLALLLAIKQVESGADMGPLVSHNKNGTRDIGVYQINDFWLPRIARFGLTEPVLQSPCGGAVAAALILRYEYRRAGDWIGAVAHYHSPTPALQKRYLTKVFRVWRALARAASQ